MMLHGPKRRHIGFALLMSILGTAAFAAEEKDSDWTANAVVDGSRIVSDDSIGAGQGAFVSGDKVYVYGDRDTTKPRVGVIKEFRADLTPTGKMIVLTDRGKPVIVHPTGLTFHPEHGYFIGDTVNGQGTIYHLDWPRALRQGNLDDAVLAAIKDDAAQNGTRPEFVTYLGKDFLATSDYGDLSPELRLYDPKALVKAGRSSAKGVLAHKIPFPPFNQALTWNKSTGQLIAAQNVTEGRGWQLTLINLDAAFRSGRWNAPGSLVAQHILPPHNELEGTALLPSGKFLFVTSSPKANLVTGAIKSIKPRTAKSGEMSLDFSEATNIGKFRADQK